MSATTNAMSRYNVIHHLFEDGSESPCRCAPDWDMRCVCSPDKESFKHCPHRIANGVWFIDNEYDWYESALKNDFHFARRWFVEGHKGDIDWLEMVLAWKEENPMTERKAVCVQCRSDYTPEEFHTNNKCMDCFTPPHEVEEE